MARTKHLLTALRMGTALAALTAALPAYAQVAQETEQPAGTAASEEQQAVAANELIG